MPDSLMWFVASLTIGLVVLLQPGPDSADSRSRNASPPEVAERKEVQADPTQPSDELRQFLNQSKSPEKNGRTAELPKMVRRAYLAVGDHVPEALIEVDGSGLFTVQEGTEASFASRDGATITIRVSRLTSDETEIEIPATGRHFTIR